MTSPFNPVIKIVGDRLQYEDCCVSGELDSFGHNLIIYSWGSSKPGLGNTVRALQWLRAEGYKSITVKGFGRANESVLGPNSPLEPYWLKMQSKGYVDDLLTDDLVYLGVQPPELDEDDLDEFTLNRGLADATRNLAKMTQSICIPLEDSPGNAAERRLQMYSVLKAFAEGKLISQKEPIESSDEVYDMLNVDEARYGAVTQGIFSLSGNRSYAAAIEMLRHAKGAGLATVDMGWEFPMTYLHNPTTHQVFSSSGVLELSDIRRGRAFEILPPNKAKILCLNTPKSPSTIADFGWVAQLMYEQQGLNAEPEDPQPSLLL